MTDRIQARVTAESENDRIASLMSEFIKQVASASSDVRKTKRWGHVKIKLTFRDGFIALCDINDKTTIKSRSRD